MWIFCNSILSFPLLLLLLLLLNFVSSENRSINVDNDDDDHDMTATPKAITTIKPMLSTPSTADVSNVSPLPTVPTFSFPTFGSSKLFSSMPTLQQTILNNEIRFENPTPSWNIKSPIVPLVTLPTLPPFTFPTLPPFQPIIDPTTIKPINITIDPEALMDVPEIVAHWGYPVETHKVVTSDGYILTLHRIPHGKNEKATRQQKPVIFLQHGLLCTSSIWLLNLPHQSAGFILADQGFDVWLGNMRGNTYSKHHVTLKSSDPKFWKFSWEEMARHDLPAMIDYTLKTTKQSQLYYVGHSQGSLTMFAKMSEDAIMSTKIRKFFALAPVARMSHVKGIFHDLGEIYDQYNMVYQVFGDGEFLTNNLFTKLLTDIFCDQAVNNPLCENFIFAVSGPNSNQFNNSRIGIYLAHNPAGTSSRNMLHFAQMVKTRRMAKFDLGQKLNLRNYGSSTPPEYDIRRINSSIYLYYSDYDWLANTKDVEGYLIPMLPKRSMKEATKLKDFNHNDFLWGMRARGEIYEKIIGTIRMDQRKMRLEEELRKRLEGRLDGLPFSFGEELLNRFMNETMEE